MRSSMHCGFKQRKDGRYRSSFMYGGKRYYVFGYTEEECVNKRIAKIAQLEMEKPMGKNKDEYIPINAKLLRETLDDKEISNAEFSRMMGMSASWVTRTIDNAKMDTKHIEMFEAIFKVDLRVKEPTVPAAPMDSKELGG